MPIRLIGQDTTEEQEEEEEVCIRGRRSNRLLCFCSYSLSWSKDFALRSQEPHVFSLSLSHSSSLSSLFSCISCELAFSGGASETRILSHSLASSLLFVIPRRGARGSLNVLPEPIFLRLYDVHDFSYIPHIAQYPCTQHISILLVLKPSSVP